MKIREIMPRQTKDLRLTMSYEEFLEWSDEDTHAEWVKGEAIVFMPPKSEHQLVVKFLLHLMEQFVKLFGLGEVLMAPFEVKLEIVSSSREPDILFIAKENLHRLSSERLTGPPDLIVEIVSRSSVRRDRKDKFEEYAVAGVPEYWIIDSRPGKQRADFYELDENGRYQLYATEDDEIVSSKVLSGFWLRPSWLWQADTLNPLTCLMENDDVRAAILAQIQEIEARS